MNKYLDLKKGEHLTYGNFNDIDAAYLALLSLFDFSFFPKGEKPLTLKTIISHHTKKHGITKLGLLLPEGITKTIVKGIESGRYGHLKLHDSFSFVSEEENTQTKVFQLDLDKQITFVIFGSTDDSIVGWKENCMLTYTTDIPCLRLCTDYVKTRLSPDRKYIFIGHSKGGMESVYCGLLSGINPDSILKIYDFDGPGFKKEIITEMMKSPNINKVAFFTPEQSVVGRILNQPKKPVIVKSTAFGLLQHDLSTWITDGCSFVTAEKYFLSKDLIAEHVNGFIEKLDENKIKETVDEMFRVLESGGSRTLSELPKNLLNVDFEYLALPLESKLRIHFLFSYLINEHLLPQIIKEKYVIKDDDTENGDNNK